MAVESWHVFILLFLVVENRRRLEVVPSPVSDHFVDILPQVYETANKLLVSDPVDTCRARFRLRGAGTDAFVFVVPKTVDFILQFLNSALALSSLQLILLSLDG